MYRVLLIDDEPWALMSLKNVIDWPAYGFTVVGVASDAGTALKRILSMNPDVVFSDIRMPELDGLSLIRKLREDGNNMKVVFVSGFSEFEYAREGIKVGCFDYLLKPVDEEELISCLSNLKSSLDGSAELSGKNESETDGDSFLSEKRLAIEIKEFIDTHYKGVTQAILAEKYHRSNSSISRIFKENMGETYVEYLQKVRLKKAQEMLMNTNDSIEKIAEAVGYGDEFYFMKTFKKATGMTPAQFRKGL